MPTDKEKTILDAFHLSRAILVIGGFDGYFKCVNPAFSKTLGLSEQELLSTHYLKLIHPGDRERARVEIERLSRGVSTLRCVNRCRYKHGRYRQLEWTAAPVPEVGLVYASARDITREKGDEMSPTISDASDDTHALLARSDVDPSVLYSKLGTTMAQGAEIFAKLMSQQWDTSLRRRLPEKVDADKLMTAEEVAALLSVPIDYVYRMARDGRLPSPVGDRYVRFRVEDVWQWIQENRQD